MFTTTIRIGRIAGIEVGINWTWFPIGSILAHELGHAVQARWLAVINAVVLAFNLLPALPLDGGRILHAALWQARSDLG